MSEELKEEKELLKGQMEQLRNRNEEISKVSTSTVCLAQIFA